MKTIKVRVNAALAESYREAYLKVFGRLCSKKWTLARFMQTFVEDRLAEEIEFLEKDAC